jgi:hypothetical protein
MQVMKESFSQYWGVRTFVCKCAWELRAFAWYEVACSLVRFSARAGVHGANKHERRGPISETRQDGDSSHGADPPP